MCLSCHFHELGSGLGEKHTMKSGCIPAETPGLNSCTMRAAHRHLSKSLVSGGRGPHNCQTLWSRFALEVRTNFREPPRPIHWFMFIFRGVMINPLTLPILACQAHRDPRCATDL